MRARNKPSGFTLVELLVVIAVIAVLVGLLFPMFNKVRAAGKAAQCLGNMRNLSNNIANYEAQNRGNLVVGTNTATILFSLPDSGTYSTSASYNPQTCPAILDYVTAGNGMATGSYAYNNWLGFVQSQYNGLPVTLKPCKVSDSAEVAMYGDVIQVTSTGFNSGGGSNLGGSTGFVDQYWGGTLATPTTWGAPTFHGRHNGSGSVLWMDGHATLEMPVPPLPNMPVNAGYGSLQQPISYYNYNHIGYLARAQADLNSMAGLYYFVFNKDDLVYNSMSLYTDQHKAEWK